MIYCVIGNGNPRGLAKYAELKERFAEKYPESSRFHYDAETVTVEALTQRAYEDSLFGGAYLILCQRIGENKEFSPAFPALIPLLLSSPNHFLLYEEKVDAKVLTAIEKGGGKVYSFPELRAVRIYNAFDFSGAVAARDRRRAWVELQRARRSGISDEDLSRPLIWQTKVMLIASQTSAGASGLKPNVYERAKRAAQNYTFEELAELSFRVASLQPRVVAGEVEMDIELESLVLNL